MDIPNDLLKEAEDKYHSLMSSAREKDIRLSLSPELVKRLKMIFVLSDFVTKSLIKNPRILQDLLETGDLNRDYSRADYREKLDKEIRIYEDREEVARRLRAVRNREMVRIAWRDLLGIADTHKTIKELSFFAEACIDKVTEFFYSLYCMKFGIPVGERSGAAQHLVVIGLGKLGGEELNFSSDIDLIFAYPESGATSNGMSNDEFFSYMCRGIINILGEYTSEGFVFRVDTRLRPFGKGGPIVMSFDSMEKYYQIHGREWERYALIKARVVGGDIKRGNELLDRLRPFVYRRYLDYTVFDSLRQMKQRIMHETRQINILDDIKMGPGGIREIEFFVQVFQLLRGGVDLDLQTQSILDAIRALKEKSYIPEAVSHGLLEAYIFLRKLENRLQEYNDLQTHRMPKSSKERLKIAISMGFSGWESLYDHLMKYVSYVHNQFEELLSSREADKPDLFSSIWETDNKELRKKLLASAGADEPEKISSAISDLKDAPSTRTLSFGGKSLVGRLIPLVLERLLKMKGDADVFVRIIELIKKIQKRTNYISLMIENPNVIDHLLALAKKSSWIISFVAKVPALLDELIDPRSLYVPPTREEMEKDVEYRLKNTDPLDLESQMIQLALFRYTNTLRVAAADITGAISVMEVSSHLTEIAEVVLNAALRLAWDYSLKKLEMDGILEKRGFCIIGYGKLGGRELSYGSDLDLVFIHSGEKVNFYAKVAQTIIHILTTYTIMGRAYEVDTRLRPDGSSGVLAVGIEAFMEYQMKRAWTWEHQALLRARPVCGDKSLMNRFQEVRRDVLSRKVDKVRLFNEIWEMRNKIIKQLSKPIAGMFHLKYDPGGIMDMEFLIQYMTLLNIPYHSELLRWTAHIYFLEELTRLELIKRDDAKFIMDAYVRMRYIIHRLSLREKPPLVEEEMFYDIRNRFIYIWESIRKETQ